MPDRPSTGSGKAAGPPMGSGGAGGFAASLKKGGGPSLFWSEVTVQGRPRVLLLDAVSDRDGWEAEATQRIAASLVRRDIPVVGGTPVVVAGAGDIAAAIEPTGDFNCIFLTARAEGSPTAAECWRALQDGLAGEIKLFAMCTWDSADPVVSAEVLGGEETFAPVAVAQQEPMSGRGASLFFMKFFAELDMHSESTNSMSGKMVWFGHSKAREIMRRRHYDGRVGLRS
jgi:hypothetical protein